MPTRAHLIIKSFNYIFTPTGTNVTNWWDNGNNMVSWCREDKGFIVINGEAGDLDESLMVKSVHFYELQLKKPINHLDLSSCWYILRCYLWKVGKWRMHWTDR
jgi:hypothetical protein